MRFMSCAAMILMVFMALPAPTHGQHYLPVRPRAGGPFSDVPVLNAPFSADAITTVRDRLPDGSVQEHIVTAHYYRDSQGRVRAEVETPWGPYVMLDLGPGATSGGNTRGPFYVLDPVKRTYRIGGLSFGKDLCNGEGRVALPVARVTFRVAYPVDFMSEAERLRAVNAQVSRDLGVVISSHRADQIGSVDYELTNIRRDEPPAELFTVPPDYTFVHGSHDDPALVLRPWQRR